MSKPFKNTYENIRILITGHTGFKGSWLTTWLTYLGADVIGYALKPSTEPNMFEKLGLEKKITNIIGDVRDEKHLNKVFTKYQPEIVFHLAAQPLVKQSYEEPKLTYETNVMGTVNLLEAVRTNGNVKSVVNITSDKCYENKEWVYGYRENDPMGGYDPYSSSKGCSELITSAYRNSFFNPDNYGKIHNTVLATVRAGNVIGGGDWSKDRIITDCINALNNNETICIRNPKATRPWQHVLEPLSGYLWLGALMYNHGVEYSGAWNFGPKEEDINTVESMVKKINKFWGTGDYTVEKDNQQHEAELLKLDISKSNYYLNWKPVYAFDDALKITLDWYRNYYITERDMLAQTIEQINNYTKQAEENGLKWTD
jgi:CDP-glucose 4,6-dehydratase